MLESLRLKAVDNRARQEGFWGFRGGDRPLTQATERDEKEKENSETVGGCRYL